MAHGYHGMRRYSSRDEDCECCEYSDGCIDCVTNVLCSPFLLARCIWPAPRSKRSLAHLKWLMRKEQLPNHLCWVCSDYLSLTQWKFPSEPSYFSNFHTRHSHPFGSMSEISSRAQDCACCSFISKMLRSQWDGWVQLQSSSFGYWIMTDNATAPWIRGTMWMGSPLYISAPENTTKFKHSASVRLVPKSQINLDVARSWFHDCRTNHGSSCSSNRISSWGDAPYMRVIDVEEVCVVFPAPPSCQYVALSYVWGPVQGGQITLPSKPKVSLKPYYDNFPQTIKDAIAVTKAMGVKYLWIDGICIQDCSGASRVAQFGDMHKIYGNAQFTVIAAQGVSADEGLYGVRPDSRPDFIGQVSEEINKNTLLLNGLELPKDIRKSKWSTRGWCLQEQLLSERFLVFWDNQVYWQCNGTMVFEDMPLDMKFQKQKFDREQREKTQYNWQVRMEQPLDDAAEKFDVLAKIDKLHITLSNVESWTLQNKESNSLTISIDQRTAVLRPPTFDEYISIVVLYSERILTKQEDALNAVNGLLAMMALAFDTEIIYGLPECILDTALLWKPQTHIVRRCVGTIPSWSWAGWQGKIGYDTTVKVESRKLTTSSKPHFERLRPFITWVKPCPDSTTLKLVNGMGMGIRTERVAWPKDWRQAEKTGGFDSIRMKPSRIVPGTPMQLQFWTLCYLKFNDARNGLKTTDVWADRIINGDGDAVGELVFDEKQSHDPLREAHEGHAMALIVISEAQYFSDEDLNATYELYNSDTSYFLYNVLLVDLDISSGVASRRGIGKVTKNVIGDFEPVWKLVYLE